MSKSHIETIIAAQDAGETRGIVAICTAHPIVLAATLDNALKRKGPVLVEATCNQVNQDGGYTGMTPKGFRDYLYAIADKNDFPRDQIILGGDHLGPNPWRHHPADYAMKKAHEMIKAYAQAGFTKIHLDASMSCAEDPTPLPAVTIAARSAQLAATAESSCAGQRLIYVIGTEVPPPGGATEHIDTLEVTPASEALETISLHRDAFLQEGIEDALDRVVALVVQPGVEFGNENVIQFERSKAKNLSGARAKMGLIFEAHSTDYQNPACLAELVQDGFAILKVGPWLTFALREALYALDQIAAQMGEKLSLQDTLEATMLKHPADWDGHYKGDDATQKLQRHFSYSDRIRYYWARPEVTVAVDKLFKFFDGNDIPAPLISQYFPAQWAATVTGSQSSDARTLVKEHIQTVIRIYEAAL